VRHLRRRDILPGLTDAAPAPAIRVLAGDPRLL
jgi:hypothetical protein